MEPVIIIDVDRCVGCYMCTKACALAQCLEVSETSRIVELVRPEDCTGCKACMRACPYNCIVVLSEEEQVPIRAKLTLSRVRKYMNRKVITVNPTSRIEEAAYLMSKLNIGSLIIQEENEIKIITESDVLRAWAMKREKDRVLHFSNSAITVEGKTLVDEALNIMLNAEIGHLPVLENGSLSGMLSIRDILRASSLTFPIKERIFPINPKDKVVNYTVKVPVIKDTTISNVYMTLTENNLKACLVMENQNVGILSIRDLTSALASGKSFNERIEPRLIPPISGNEEIARAVAFMIEHNVRHLPVDIGNEFRMLSVKEIAKHAVWISKNN
ncbi:CBS domain-containing protein [Acidianus sp. RZ1]|uniref:CBS domain-containing protein n=1 Tax=Acidianus sp. RZ1 TaxID=1540082 RepID=UPI001492ED90|nr:CBS domain-containing protein [Acidianus sp. RZ1]